MRTVEPGKSREQLEHCFEHSTIGMAISTVDGRFLKVNPALCGLLGCDEKELMRQGYEILVHPAERAEHARLMEQLLQGESPGAQREGRLPTREGDPRWVVYEVSLGRNSGGDPPQLLTQLHEITAYKRAEETLREREEFQRLILEMAHDAFISIDATGVITSWNREAERTLGWSASEAIGRELAETIIPEKHRAAHHGGLQRFLSTGEGPVLNRRLELSALRKDGREIPVELTIFPILWKNQYTFHAFLHDIGPEKESEKRIARQISFVQLLGKVAVASNEASTVEEAFQACLNEVAPTAGCPVGHVCVPDPSRPGYMLPTDIWYLDGTERFDVFRKVTAETVLGPGEGLPGRVLANRKPAWIRDVTLDTNFPRARVARELGVRGAFAFPVMVGAEVVAVLEFFSIESREPDQDLLEIMGLVGTQLGRVVERTRAEQHATRRALELERSNAELEQFAYVASHDLQEPLRMVTSYVQLLERRSGEKLDADAREYISYVVDGAARMRTLIDDLLSVSRLNTSAVSMAPSSCEDALAGALRNLRLAMGECGAIVTHDPLPTVVADRVQLGQLFQNLIGNALKFRGQQPPRIHIQAERRGSAWLLAVRDNGIGIDPEFKQRIFMLFQRLHGREKYPGTGIGLAICKKIVENHGGRIWVESKRGEGATFYFTLEERGGRST